MCCGQKTAGNMYIEAVGQKRGNGTTRVNKKFKKKNTSCS